MNLKNTERKTQQEGTQPSPLDEPAVLIDETFETLALSCAKANPIVCPGGNPDRS